MAEMLFKASAVDLYRTGIPRETSVTVQRYMAMRVPEGFVIDGELVLLGELKVVHDD